MRDPSPIVFVGPSIPLVEASQILSADFRAPCRRGDLCEIAAGSVVGIIDGVFHQTEAVSPREILQAIQRGVHVFGCSSMGALRALEVPAMHGMGHVYEMYARGIIDSDDEVALVFDPERLEPLTVPLVNVRYAVDRLRKSGTIQDDVAAQILSAAKDLHYTERTYRRILAEAGLCGRADAPDLIGLLTAFDLKRDDARLMLEHIARLDIHQLDGPDPEARQPVSIRRAPDYGPPDDFALVPFSRTAADDAPVFVWETGDRLEFPALIEYLKMVGRFDAYASRAVTRLLLQNTLGTVTVDVAPIAQVRRDFRQRCRLWGWRAPEEVRVTMADLGLGLRDVLAYLRSDAVARGVVATLSRKAERRFLKALRCELFSNDLALKREAMTCSAIQSLARSVSRPSRAHVAWAKDLMCRLHEVATWDRVEWVLRSLGVPRQRIRTFVRTLAAAKRATDAMRQSRAPRVRRAADAELGLAPSPKAAGDARFSVSIDEAHALATRLATIIGVTRIGMIDALGNIAGVYVSQVARPSGAWSSTYGSGKSDSKAGAVVGGIMEETEKWSQEQFCGDPVSACFEDLRQCENALDPRLLDLPHDSLYTERLPFRWQRCMDLITGRSIMVPLAALTVNAGRNNIYYSRRGARNTFSTNGLASGFNIADAMVHATCEYIERHAAKLGELRIDNPGLRRSTKWPRAIDLVSAPASIRHLLDSLQAADYTVRLWDITSDIAVPTVQAHVVRDRQCAPGWAAHPDPAVACHKALLEACQTILSLIAGGREDLTIQARSLGRHERPRPLRPNAELFWSGGASAGVTVEQMCGLRTNDVYEEFNWVRARIVDAGVTHLIALDLTPAAIRPARVVRVIVPGLETTNPFHCGRRARIELASDILLH